MAHMQLPPFSPVIGLLMLGPLWPSLLHLCLKLVYLGGIFLLQSCIYAQMRSCGIILV